ncbi:MAG: methyltransferase domain-containing protein [Kiritimatiellae bacterium]|nr:methyltransferase domain-containing protein [Kiritimatiellia bacterium]
MRQNNPTCPLCKTDRAHDYFSDQTRDYYRCQICQLIFVLPSQFLSANDEKARYDLHNNSSDDPKYRQFLSRTFNRIQTCIPPGSHGLDFGSGPGPTLSVMFEQAGHRMEIYDPYYAKDPSVLQRQYDFITATEVLEHIHNPAADLNRLWTCLKPGAILGIMTKSVFDKNRFSRWHYKDDPTHVCFYSMSTFKWLACQWQADLTIADKDVILIEKNR